MNRGNKRSRSRSKDRDAFRDWFDKSSRTKTSSGSRDRHPNETAENHGNRDIQGSNYDPYAANATSNAYISNQHIAGSFPPPPPTWLPQTAIADTIAMPPVIPSAPDNKTSHKPSIMQSIMDSIDKDDEDDVDHTEAIDVEEHIRKLISHSKAKHSSAVHERFALHYASVTLSRRLAGKELYDNAVLMISQANITPDVHVAELTSPDDQLASIVGAEAKDQEHDHHDDVKVAEVEEKSTHITSIVKNTDYDDLYGDIGDNNEDFYADIDLGDEKAVDPIASKPTTDTPTDTAVDSSPEAEPKDEAIVPIISYTIPYSAQTFSTARFAAMSRAAKGQSIAADCNQLIPTLSRIIQTAK